ncbi:MAG: GST-like protein [Sphingomonadales bacterium]|nr:GST-like protein [Sphingomonadales bacterium]
MIDLHYVRTSNGQKITIMLEETGLEYRVVEYDMFAGAHLKPEFKTINPNHKLPVIIDQTPADGGAPITVFETGAILIYLADKTGSFLPREHRGRMTVIQWLAWQISGLGPMLGQGYHFARYAPEGQDYGVARYTREARRLLSVLNYQLGNHAFVAGAYSIADMACWPWVQNIANLDLSRSDYPAVQRWFDTVASRPAVLRALQSSDTAVPAAYLKKRMTLTPDEWSNLFGDNALQAVET